MLLGPIVKYVSVSKIPFVLVEKIFRPPVVVWRITQASVFKYTTLYNHHSNT